MTSDAARQLARNHSRKSFSLVALMLLFSLSPLLSTPAINAQDSSGGNTSWEKNGSADTGWVLLEASGADSITGQTAFADWPLDFAPGAEISNLTFEVRVDGSNGTSIVEPKLYPVNTADLLFDYSGYGTFGEATAFDGGNPHEGRMTPNTDTNAVWTLPERPLVMVPWGNVRANPNKTVNALERS